MLSDNESRGRIEKAVHGILEVPANPEYVTGLAEDLKKSYTQNELLELYQRFAHGQGDFDLDMRKVFWQALSKQCGDALRVDGGVEFKHLDTFSIGSGVFIGRQTYLQGWYKGNCRIGDRVWIGPGSYFDARDLVIEDDVGWGPGAKVLGSTHTALPVDIPIIQTDLSVKPVRIGRTADIGTNAVILPGVTIGEGAIIGAGAVVAKDVAPYAVVAGVPAAFLHWREGYTPEKDQ